MDPALRVGIVAMPDLTLLSFSTFIEFLRHSADERDYSRQIACTWDLLSHDDAPITASCGVPLLPTRQYGDPRDFDYIVVQGGLLHSTRPVPEELIAFVSSAVEHGVPVIGLCTGVFLLARLGYLDGLRAAVHFSLVEELQVARPAVIPVSDQAVVRDGGFITCPGGLAAITLGMELVTEHLGTMRSEKALHYFLADREADQIHARMKDQVAELDCSDQRVMNAVGLMRQRMYETGTVAEIARAVGVTERELTRLFAEHVRTPPALYWRQIRLKAAHWLVLNSNRSMMQIAHECGFSDSSHLIRWFKRTYQVTPAKLRELRTQLGSH